MILPSLKYSQNENTGDLHAFKGLNRRDTIQSGELSDCENLSARAYPALSPRKSRDIYRAYGSPTALFEWDGHVIVVDGNILYYDGTTLDNVLSGEKQFAVVNTRLIIWPDAAYIDLTTGKYARLDGKITTSSAGTFTANSLTANAVPKIAEGVISSKETLYSGYCTYDIYTYGTNTAAIGWSSGSGWSLPASSLDSAYWDYNHFNRVAVGSIFIPRLTNGCFYPVVGTYSEQGCFGVPAGDYPPYTSLYNNSGYYAVITSVSDGTIDYDVYQVGLTNKLFSSSFSVGDRITVSLGSTVYAEKAKISAIDDSTNTLTFSTNVFTAGTAPAGLTLKRDIPDFAYICSCNNRLYGCSNSAQNKVWDPSTQSYKTFSSRCLYVSALGLPWNFWSFDGADTDSYQVAVSSEGDFTCAVALDGSVLYHKEKLVYRLYGEYPSNFYLSEYSIPGCAAGCHKTAKIINEVLYYLAPHGVYAYAGNTPTLISYSLGDFNAARAAAGVKEARYWLSVRASTGNADMYVYDTESGFWLREDGTDALDFATVGGVLYFIKSQQVLMAESGSETVTWYAVLKDEDEGTFERKYWLYLRLRIWLPKGSALKISWAYDDDPKLYSRTIRTFNGYSGRTVNIGLNNRRADRITVRIDGTGDAKISDIQRVFLTGSEEVR